LDLLFSFSLSLDELEEELPEVPLPSGDSELEGLSEVIVTFLFLVLRAIVTSRRV
jgi:hypothetical protein